MENSVEKFESLTIGQVSQVYVGKDRHCRCGCGGDYVATSFMVEPRSEVNDKLAKSRITKAKKLVEQGAELRVEPTYFNVSYGNNRAITIYTEEIKQQ